MPESAALLDAVISAALPDPELPVIPLPLDNVIGVFERLTGNPAWRQYEFLAPGGPRPTHFFDRNPALDLRRAPFEVQ